MNIFKRFRKTKTPVVMKTDFDLSELNKSTESIILHDATLLNYKKEG